MTSIVRTVNGDISGDDLGLVLPHEHVFIDFEWPAERHTFDGILDDPVVARRELTAFADSVDRGTLVDLTVPGIGRDPVGLQQISTGTGLNIVMGCGWYREPYYGNEVDPWPVERLTEILVEEISHGVGPERIRPGIVGEIGSHKGYVTAQEERVFRAAGRAAALTGLGVSTHSVADLRNTVRCGRPVGIVHLDLLESEGVDPSRVAIGHCDAWMRLDYHRQIAERGAFVQFDNLGEPTWGPRTSPTGLADRMIDHLVELCSGGFIGQVLLSQDVCRKSYLQLYGGNGYDYIASQFVDRLAARGFTDDDVRTLMYDNPRRLLEIEPHD
ncbi:MAG: phosphotriesterase-related protein [Frankiales bacterium]|nr:phosphotriesterase-related protein [Frankiales bacterium]